MKKRLLNTALLSSLVLSTTLLAADAKMFVGVSGGYTHLNVDQTDKAGSIILANSQKEDGYNLELKAGYKYSDKLQFSLNYQRVTLDDVFENNFYAEADYLFEGYKEFTPFIGVNLGYSELEYSKEPMNTTDNNYVSGSWLVGARAGIFYPLANNIDLNAEYMFNVTNHITHLVSGSAESELKHNYSHNLNLGVRYSF